MMCLLFGFVSGVWSSPPSFGFLSAKACVKDARCFVTSVVGSVGVVSSTLWIIFVVFVILLLLDSVLGTSCLSLRLELLLTENFSLLLVDGLNQDILVLELVTLGGEVEFVVHFSVDLLGLTISLEESSEDASSSHPEDLLRHTGVAATLSASSAIVAT